MVIFIDSVVFNIVPSVQTWVGSAVVLVAITGITFADKIEKQSKTCSKGCSR